MFVSFEGLDGSGKTTQVERLRPRLEARGPRGRPRASPAARRSARDPRRSSCTAHEMTPWAEALLYAAARAELVAEVIRPALARGADVLLDRYVDSSVAYQGIARGLGLERVLELNLAGRRRAPAGPDVPARGRRRASLRRRVGDGPRPDRARERALPRRGRGRLPRLAELYPERIVVLDGTLPPETIAGGSMDDLRRPA